MRCGAPGGLVWFNESSAIGLLYHEARLRRRVNATLRRSSTSDEITQATAKELAPKCAQRAWELTRCKSLVCTAVCAMDGESSTPPRSIKSPVLHGVEGEGYASTIQVVTRLISVRW
jgi:hypothetical protein